MHPTLRSLGLALTLTVFPLAVVHAQVNVGIQIALPGVRIGVNLPSYPTMVRVPGYPVYYDPDTRANYFFHDGLYWVYAEDNWYSSGWYNGPWTRISRYKVPVFVLRIPVRYYRQPPPYFQGWRTDAAPRWDQHWGREWAQRRPGWNRWDRKATPAPAQLPRYQQNYTGDRYPDSLEQQRAIRTERSRPKAVVPAREDCRPGDKQCRPAKQPSRQDKGREKNDEHGDHGRR